ncbi:uncharacterized protein [Primulina eburnea]|uniref:uncharacterized protein n=1 Tax=Primulina eburnea TaxID=1245227 RepID=UPI003C6BE420
MSTDGTTSPSPAVPETIFSAGSSSIGFHTLKRVATPADETMLLASKAGDLMMESFNLLLASGQMARAAFEKMGAYQKSTEARAASAQALHDEAQARIVQLQGLHADALLGQSTTIDCLQGQLGEARAEIVSLKAQLEKAEARVEKLDLDARAALDNFVLATQRVAELEATLAAREADLKARAILQEEWRAAFLATAEFQQLVINKAIPYFKAGFNKCKAQVREAGLLPLEKKGILDLARAVNSLPEDGAELPAEEESEVEEDSGPETAS